MALLTPLTKTRLYYLCQVAGWGGYGLALSVFSSLYPPHELSPNEIYSNLILCLISFGLTHLFRDQLKRHRWIEFPLPRLAVLVLAASFLMSVVAAASTVLLTLVYGMDLGELRWEDVSLLVVNYMTLFLLWSVIYFAIAFFSRYRKEEIERLKWENALKEFELNKLKSQLNPHFVFNALNGIRSLVEEDPGKAKSAITQLSNILRSSLLSDRTRTIPFSEEMKTVNDYLNLEKIRFDERLQFQTDLEPATLSVQVPPMMIQTLVENAVKHGISSRVEGGRISVKSRLQRNFAEIRIENTGILKGTGSDGFGIVNTLHRLELIYNKTDLFSIEQSEKELVSATVKIPIPLK